MSAAQQILPWMTTASTLAVTNAASYQRRITTLASAAMTAAAAKAARGDLQALQVIPPATQAIADATAHAVQVSTIAPTLPSLFG